MAPLRHHWRIRGAARNVAADRHRPERTAVIALLPRNNAVAGRLFPLQEILPREFDRGLGGFGAFGGKINASAILKIAWRESEDTRRELLRWLRVELRRVHKRDLTGLGSHRPADFLNAVSDADDSRLAGGVQIAAAGRVENPRALASHSDRVWFPKIPRKKRCRVGGRAHIRIVAEGPEGTIGSRLAGCRVGRSA